MSYAEPYLASLYQVGWDEETTYKTRPTNLDRYIRCYTEPEIPWPVREVETMHAGSHGRGPATAHDQQRQEMKGTLPIVITSGEILGAIFGAGANSGSGPDYTHTYTISNAMPGSFGVQFGFPMTGNNLIQEFLGCRVNDAVFKSSEDDEKLKCDIGYLAAKAQDGGATLETITTNVDPPFTFKQGVFSSTALYTGAKARIHAFELPVNINAKSNHAGGGTYQPYDILPGKADFGEMLATVGLEDDTEWDEIFDEAQVGTIYDYEYLFTRGTNDTLEFTGNAKLKAMPVELTEHDVRVQLTLIPYTLSVILVNTTETWPFCS